jgi:hypothetical protein
VVARERHLEPLARLRAVALLYLQWLPAVRRVGSTSATAPRQTRNIGQNAVPTKWSEPPSGYSAAIGGYSSE